MRAGEFRCAFFARDYARSLEFYRDELELPVVDAWDHGPDDQGTVFGAASGLIEVLRLPRRQEADSVWDFRTPQGVMIVLESIHRRITNTGRSHSVDVRGVEADRRSGNHGGPGALGP